MTLQSLGLTKRELDAIRVDAYSMRILAHEGVDGLWLAHKDFARCLDNMAKLIKHVDELRSVLRWYADIKDAKLPKNFNNRAKRSLGMSPTRSPRVTSGRNTVAKAGAKAP